MEKLYIFLIFNLFFVYIFRMVGHRKMRLPLKKKKKKNSIKIGHEIFEELI